MFYKFIDETTIERAPKPLKIDGKDVYTNSEAIHNENGYFKIEHTECPQDENSYEVRYALYDNLIVQEWVVSEVQND